MCFRKMRSILSSSDSLIYPDFNKPFLLTTDASDHAIGAVLSQGEVGKDKPIHFASRILSRFIISIVKYSHTIHSSKKYTPYEVVIPSSHIIETVYKNLLTTQTRLEIP